MFGWIADHYEMKVETVMVNLSNQLYQQNKQLPLTSKNVAMLNQFVRSQPSSLDNWISNDNTDKKNNKNMHRFTSTKKPTHYHKND